MDNARKLIRVNVGDFLEIRPLNEVGKRTKGRGRNLTLMGLCFSSKYQWQKGQVLFIDYFIPEELDSVRLKMVVIWTEFVDSENGYFCGGEITEVEKQKEAKFANYYFKKIQERFFEK